MHGQKNIKRGLRFSVTALPVLWFRVTMREEWPGPVSKHKRIVRDYIVFFQQHYTDLSFVDVLHFVDNEILNC